MMSMKTQRIPSSLCILGSLSTLRREIELPQYQCGYDEHSALWVSVNNDEQKDATDPTFAVYTWLTFNASPKCWAPLVRMMLPPTFRRVSVCEQRRAWTYSRFHLRCRYLVHSHRFAEISSSLFTDHVTLKIQCCECLWTMMSMQMQQIPSSLYILGSLPTLRREIELQHHQCC